MSHPLPTPRRALPPHVRLYGLRGRFPGAMPCVHGPMRDGRTAACSSRCRATLSRRRQAEALRAVLLAALDVVDRMHRPRKRRSARR
jgi:hypothetical protein